MAALFGPPPQVIWLRCGNQPTAHIETLFRNHVQVIASFEHDPAAACRKSTEAMNRQTKTNEIVRFMVTGEALEDERLSI